MSSHDDLVKQKIESSIDHIPVPESIFAFAKELPFQVEKQQNPRLTRKPRWRKWLAVAAASIFIGISTGAYISPTFAAYIKSFFIRPELDEGLQTAAKEGFSQKTEAAVTDHGITFRIKEVMADTNRLIFTYSLENKNGKLIDPTILFEKEQWGPKQTMYFVKHANEFYITNEKGEVVSTNRTYQTNTGRMVSQSIDQVFPHDHYADLMFSLNDKALEAKQLFIHIDLNQIGTVNGQWKLKIPVNIDKSMLATKTVPIGQTYVTDDGLQITVKKLVYSPTLTSIELETSWTEEGKERLKSHPEYLLGDQMFYEPLFDIVDSNGNIVATTLPRWDIETSKREVFVYKKEFPSRQPNVVRWRYSFLPFSPKGTYTFVFRGIERTEFPNQSLTFSVEELKKQPISLRYKGNTLTIHQLRLETNKENESTGILDVETNSYLGMDFQLNDEKQHFYTINTKDSWWPTIISYDEKKMMYKIKSNVEVEGMDKIPKQLTITLKSVIVFDPSENWHVSLPASNE
ncbi:hypothetical protein H839_02206 [Parageobacillus genomosp. 1]|uniref:DUF4179 domain-containing protein n=1 Tax=Parageobacillus genomosp. 1 TaxID=1295642 RepID=A0ABC9VIT6_9BACL|nr:DUF4179 domain-containing protein [Parageobacillus genomosp. 1]EZP78643.1 hypothetical protein H839_02206 [Parageobacillus genomosp. 1]